MIQEKPIITELGRVSFAKLLENNPGLVILKFGAKWCGPCATIKPFVEAFFASSPANVICGDLDVDENFDIYSFLKAKKMVNGIPVMLCYRKGNTTYIPDDSITGANPAQLDAFFKRCGAMAMRG